MLAPEGKPPVTRDFITYDLEWYPHSYELRVVGVFDGSKYTYYTSIADFLDGTLTEEHSGQWMYAHAGGISDMTFLLEILCRSGRYELEAAFSGSSAVIVNVKRGRYQWTFVDSYWLLRAKLADIGESLGMAKGECAFDAPFPELRDYNELDCRILWRAINDFQRIVLGLGGQMEKTIASTAMSLFRRRYLHRVIQTSETVNEAASCAYIASRVERIQRGAPPGTMSWDINSSFPFAMKRPLPANLIGISRRIPRAGVPYLVEADIHVPKMHLPPVPVRRGGRVFFPVGNWRGWFSTPDIEALEESGGSVVKVVQCLEFEAFTDMGEYVDDIYGLRKAARDDSYEKLVYKIFLNSLYGKTAESQYKQRLLVGPAKLPCSTCQKKECTHCIQKLFPGAFLQDIEVEIPHRHVPIATYITSQARLTLLRYLRQCSLAYYCDTDGFSASPKDVFPQSKELGGLKLVKKLKWKAHYHQPKLYREDDVIKSKGFHGLERDPKTGNEKSRALTVEEYETLLEGGKITVPRMVRVREMLKSGDLTPREKTISKGLRPDYFPKRCQWQNGKSRPWTISELKSKVRDRAPPSDLDFGW